MKKLITFLTALACVILLCACGAAENSVDLSESPAATPSMQLSPEIPEVPDGELKVYFLDVGQADATLLVQGDAAMLIDGGNVVDSSYVASILQSFDIKNLDYVIGTHAHEDHIGGLSGALSVCTAGTVFIPEQGSDTKAYKNFIEKANLVSEEVRTPEENESFYLGDALVEFIGPLEEFVEDDNLNNNSLCCFVTFGETTFAFTGDAEYEVENKMYEDGLLRDVDILKAPHHGSSTSSSYTFLRELMPEYVVSEVGKNNDYGHPHEETLSKYRDLGAEVYRTDLQGMITVTTDGTNISFETEKYSDETNPTIKTPVEAEYIGNLNSQVFHRESCENLPAEHNQVIFETREDAIAAGYKPCGVCKP